ncbi:MAG: hypothetical protein A2X30_10825 [Elusimicrobia bacterium GWB2_63_16]|nr:MAG: hypothetical protein A2X30_10825 [Elusimicrobia bacterium GWB2_63_16]
MAPRKKILVVDDDKTLQMILKTAFKKAGYQVIPALDAMQGLMMARQVKPDLVVLDMMMPAGGGQSVYERLQMMAGSFEVPVLIYSAMPPQEIAKFIPEGPQIKVLNKSATIAEVLAAAEALLAGA